MRNVVNLLFSGAVAALAVACGGDVVANGGGGGHTFSISADSAVSVDGIGDVMPANGRVFVDVAIVIENTSSAAPVTVAPSFFSLELASSVRVLGSTDYSMLLGKPCAQDLSVAAGGSLLCHVVFEALMGDPPTRLFYLDQGARQASTVMPDVVQRFTLASGTYWLTNQRIADNTCAFSYDALQSYTLLVAGDKVSFGGLPDVLGKHDSPVTMMLSPNEHSLAQRDGVWNETGSSMVGCSYDYLTGLEMHVTARNEFEAVRHFQSTHRLGCRPRPDKTDCLLEATLHYQM